ncbi:MAG: hypothetical protein WCF19_03045 [Chlamydiales bacterium]
MKKRTISLIEIMIVIFIITLITGTIGYNMKGSMDKGRKFRTEQAIDQLHDLLLICLAEGKNPDELAKHPAKYIDELGLAKNPDKLIVDGWGELLTIVVKPGRKDFDVYSENIVKKKE